MHSNRSRILPNLIVGEDKNSLNANGPQILTYKYGGSLEHFGSEGNVDIGTANRS